MINFLVEIIFLRNTEAEAKKSVSYKKMYIAKELRKIILQNDRLPSKMGLYP